MFQPYIAASARSLYVSDGTRIRRLESRTGRLANEFPAPPGEFLSGPTVVREGLTVAAGRTFLHAVDDNGKEVWRYAFARSVPEGEFAVSHPAVIGADGVIIVAGLDGNLHAIDSRTGTKRWLQPIAGYGRGVPAFLLGISPGLVLADTRASQSEPPHLVGLATEGTSATVRFTARLGIDVSSLVAGGQVGIVTTSYVETTSRRGSTIMAAFDGSGARRWAIDRGRNEKVLAITPDGELVTTSQDAAGDDPGALLEFWLANGEPRDRLHVDAPIYAATVGADQSIYGIGCKGAHSVVYHVGRDRGLKTTMDLGEGCPVAAAMDGAGRLFVAHPVASGEKKRRSAVEVVALRTASKAVAATGWAMPRADPHGSGAFALFSEKR